VAGGAAAGGNGLWFVAGRLLSTATRVFQRCPPCRLPSPTEVREPTAAVFSAESMLRGMGVPLAWSLTQPLGASGNAGAAAECGGGRGGDVEAGLPAPPRGQAALLEVRGGGKRVGWGGSTWFLSRRSRQRLGLGPARLQPALSTSQPPAAPPPAQADPAHDELWAELAALPPSAPLPAALPAAFYTQAASYLRGAQYADRLAAWAEVFPPEKCAAWQGAAWGGRRAQPTPNPNPNPNPTPTPLAPPSIMVVDFRRFVDSPEAVVREVLAFVGVEQDRWGDGGGRWGMLAACRRLGCWEGDRRGARLPLASGVPSTAWQRANPPPPPRPSPLTHTQPPARYAFRRLPPGMAGDYRGAKMHPATRAAVAARWFAAANAALFEMLGVDGLPGWDAPLK
jgi:hypothetical protein